MNSITISTVVGNDMKITVATDGNYTAFAGVAKNNTFNIERSVDRVGELLVRAVNNRTRERNFFRLYADMLEQNITEEEYSRQLEECQDEYVLPLPVEADMAILKRQYNCQDTSRAWSQWMTSSLSSHSAMVLSITQ